MTTIATWNIRGLNFPAKQKAIKELVLQYKIAIIGLVETKVKEENVEKVVKGCS